MLNCLLSFYNCNKKERKKNRSPPAITFFSPIKIEINEKKRIRRARNSWYQANRVRLVPVATQYRSIFIGAHAFLSRCTFRFYLKTFALSLNKGNAYADVESITIQDELWGCCVCAPHTLQQSLISRSIHFIEMVQLPCNFVLYYLLQYYYQFGFDTLFVWKINRMIY